MLVDDEHHWQLTSEGHDIALAKVRQKYLDSFLKTDLHFFLGTMKEFHGYSPNPWVSIGVLPLPKPPEVDQMELL